MTATERIVDDGLRDWEGDGAETKRRAAFDQRIVQALRDEDDDDDTKEK